VTLFWSDSAWANIPDCIACAIQHSLQYPTNSYCYYFYCFITSTIKSCLHTHRMIVNLNSVTIGCIMSTVVPYKISPPVRTYAARYCICIRVAKLMTTEYIYSGFVNLITTQTWCDKFYWYLNYIKLVFVGTKLVCKCSVVFCHCDCNSMYTNVRCAATVVYTGLENRLTSHAISMLKDTPGGGLEDRPPDSGC